MIDKDYCVRTVLYWVYIGRSNQSSMSNVSESKTEVYGLPESMVVLSVNIRRACIRRFILREAVERGQSRACFRMLILVEFWLSC
jgi:hypothetical protein